MINDHRVLTFSEVIEILILPYLSRDSTVYNIIFINITIIVANITGIESFFNLSGLDSRLIFCLCNDSY